MFDSESIRARARAFSHARRRPPAPTMFQPVPIEVHDISDDELEEGEIDAAGGPVPPPPPLPEEADAASAALQRVSVAEAALSAAESRVESLGLALRDACAQAASAARELEEARQSADEAFVHVAPFSEAMNVRAAQGSLSCASGRPSVLPPPPDPSASQVPAAQTVRVFAHFPTCEPEMNEEALLTLCACRSPAACSALRRLTSLQSARGARCAATLASGRAAPKPSPPSTSATAGRRARA